MVTKLYLFGGINMNMFLMNTAVNVWRRLKQVIKLKGSEWINRKYVFFPLRQLKILHIFDYPKETWELVNGLFSLAH